MPEEKISKKTRWECQMCGMCCTGPILTKEKNLSVEKNNDQVCKFLSKEKICLNYNERPFICRTYPFIISLDNINENGTAKPQKAFSLENLKIHSECPGYGKGKRIYANKNLQRKFSRLAYDFALRFKECFEKGKDISKLI